jgi:hypothetical protein
MWRRRQLPRLLYKHPGVRIRISVPTGKIVDADSLQLYYSARFGSAAENDPCTPECRPGCDTHGWSDLVGGMIGELGQALPIEPGFSTVPLRIQIKPVELTDFDA